MERETGIGPATNSLEGCDSTTELLPLMLLNFCGIPIDSNPAKARIYGYSRLLQGPMPLQQMSGADGEA
jgi:hypothetical protein